MKSGDESQKITLEENAAGNTVLKTVLSLSLIHIFTDLVLIAERKDNKYSSKISTTGNISLGNLAEGIGFLCKGVSLSSEGTSSVYWFNLSGNIIERLYFDHCRIEFMVDKNFSNFNNAKSGIKNLLIESCLSLIHILDSGKSV